MTELNLWTDGSNFLDKIVYNYVLLTEDTYINREIFISRGVRDSLKAEVFAVTKGLRYINENNLHEQYSGVIVLSDFRDITDNYYHYMAGKLDMTKLFPRYVWKELFDEIDKMKMPLTITHFRSHQDDVNPNKLCDLTCRLIKKSLA